MNRFVGRWGCVEFGDIQLNIFEDGKVVVNHFDTDTNSGEYGISVKATVADDDFVINDERIQTKLNEGITDFGVRALTGDFYIDGKKYNATFLFSDDFPDEIEYCIVPNEGLVEIDSDFAVSIDELVGQYKCEDPYFTEINIFNIDGKMRFVLSFDGTTCWDPLCVWCDRGGIVWMINDAYNRRICRLYPQNGKLVGWLTQAGKIARRIDVVFERVSDIPQDKNEDSEKLALPNKPRIDILRENAEYTTGAEEIKMEFELGGELPAIIAEFGYSDYVKGKSGDELAFACLDFMGDNFHHKGDIGMPPWKHRSLAEMLQWCKERNCQANCRGLSIMLAAILRYNGIKAQHITCCPYEEPFNDCHVVVDCILPSGKRIMLDPTYRAYLLDRDGEYVSLPGLRDLLIKGEKFTFNSTAKYTGLASDYQLTTDDYREYMSKNSIRYSRDKVNADGRDECDLVVLYPASYPVDAVGYNETTVLTTDEGAFWNL